MPQQFYGTPPCVDPITADKVEDLINEVVVLWQTRRELSEALAEPVLPDAPAGDSAWDEYFEKVSTTDALRRFAEQVDTVHKAASVVDLRLRAAK